MVSQVLRRRCRPQVWLLTAMSMLAISCATIVLVKAEGHVLGRAVNKVYSHTILWVIKSVTQESEWRTSSLRKESVVSQSVFFSTDGVGHGMFAIHVFFN